jgi:hypothetical protein
MVPRWPEVALRSRVFSSPPLRAFGVARLVVTRLVLQRTLNLISSGETFATSMHPPNLYYVSRSGQQFGPYTAEQLTQSVVESRFLASDLAWRAGVAEWVPLSQLMALDAISSHVTREKRTLDLSKGPYTFSVQSITDLVASLKAALPPQMELKLSEVRLRKGGKTPAIKVRDGLWRGAVLTILNTNQQLALGGILYRVPTFAAKAMVFIGMCVAFSVVFTIFASMGGGVVGAMVSGNIENMIAKNLRDSSWAVELNQAIEKVSS